MLFDASSASFVVGSTLMNGLAASVTLVFYDASTPLKRSIYHIVLGNF